jgi:DNA helicase HerA-like ATPase
MTLGQTLDNRPVHIDLDRLVEGRLMLQANSGAGKSWALRRLIEQTAG